jgi:hypothetical protein
MTKGFAGFGAEEERGLKTPTLPHLNLSNIPLLQTPGRERSKAGNLPRNMSSLMVAGCILLGLAAVLQKFWSVSQVESAIVNSFGMVAAIARGLWFGVAAVLPSSTSIVQTAVRFFFGAPAELTTPAEVETPLDAAGITPPSAFVSGQVIYCAGTAQNGPCKKFKMYVQGEGLYLCHVHKKQRQFLGQ